jgi:hypothetical protein
VKSNRAKHIAEYKEAVEGYKAAAIKAIDRAMNRLKKRVQELETGEVLVLQAVTFDLQVPNNHAKDYDKVITMLEMSVDEELEIQADEFTCYVMDNWEWKENFQSTHRMYSRP